MDPRSAKYASSRTDSTMRRATPERPGGLVSSGPVSSGPVSAGPVSSGPVLRGPVLRGPVLRGPVLRGPGSSSPSERAMTTRLSSVFPRPAASDADDVVWTLQTAAVQWQRGLRADAIVWVRKAAETATQIGHSTRAEELRSHAARLAEFLWTDPEETIQDPPLVPLARPTGRRLAVDEAEEILELEELDAEELEFTENELPTPDDAVADISEEDLTYYREGGEGSEPTNVLPDDLDLRSDSERPVSSSREAYLSITPDADEESDSYISISPEEDTEHADEGAAYASNGTSTFRPPISDQPTRPRIERPSMDGGFD